MRKIGKYLLVLISIVVVTTIIYITKVSNTGSTATAKEVEYKDLESNEVKKEILNESNIKKSYDIDKAKNEETIIYLTDKGEFTNKYKIESFLKEMEEKKAVKLRFTQYSGDTLDKMRDLEFDGEKLILKEYDTKSPEEEKYYYIESTGEKIELIDGYYKLLGDKGKYLKLFPQ